METEKHYVRAFNTPAGAAVLEHLRSITFGRVLGANATDAELRTLEGGRALVRMIENMVKRGME